MSCIADTLPLLTVTIALDSEASLCEQGEARGNLGLRLANGGRTHDDRAQAC